jgi:hypothetical protein
MHDFIHYMRRRIKGVEKPHEQRKDKAKFGEKVQVMVDQ